MCNRLVIVGAGGHGKVIADIALHLGYRTIVFLDDHAEGTCVGFPILGASTEILRYDDGLTDFVIAIGNNMIRRTIAEKYAVSWVTLVHPTAVIGSNVQLGEGTVVMAQAVINPCAEIGEHCIINTAAVVEHDNKLGDFVHISPKAALGGTVCIGNGTHIGIGAAVKNNVAICASCTVGAGAVVVKDIIEKGTYIGVPAKLKET